MDNCQRRCWSSAAFPSSSWAISTDRYWSCTPYQTSDELIYIFMNCIHISTVLRKNPWYSTIHIANHFRILPNHKYRKFLQYNLLNQHTVILTYRIPIACRNQYPPSLQYYDLQRAFHKFNTQVDGKMKPGYMTHRFVFMGDYVDRWDIVLYDEYGGL